MDMAVTNPLFLVDTLEKLFKFLPSQELLGFRIVSKPWNEGVINVLRKRHDIQRTLGMYLDTDKDFLKYLRQNPGGFVPSVIVLSNLEDPDPMEGEDEINRINQQLKTTPEIFFHRGNKVVAEICGILGARGIVRKLELYFNGPDFNDPVFGAGYLLKILGSVSSSLEILGFSIHCDMSNTIFSILAEDFPKVLAEFQKTPLRKLRHVDFYGHIAESDRLWHFRIAPGFHEWLKIILSSASSLTKFNYYGGELHTILLFSEIGRLSQICSEFHIFSDNATMDFDILLNTQNSIRKLSIADITLTRENAMKLQKVLESQSKTLNSLSLVLAEQSEFFQIPELPELTSLELYLRSEIRVNFTRDTPKLQSLVIGKVHNDEYGLQNFWKNLQLDNSLAGNVVPCDSLRELGLKCVNPDCCSYLEELFPNIETLQLENPTKDFLQMVWTCWENLKCLDLKLDIKTDIDELLFGLEMEWMAEILQERKFYAIPPQPANSNLTNLKNLETMKLKINSNYFDDGGLTIFSIRFGLAEMNKLRNLKISDNMLSPSLEELLKVGLPHLLVDYFD